MPETLVHRYTYGNFARLPLLSLEADFFLGVPARQRELLAVAKAQVHEQRTAAKALAASNLEAAGAICAELSIQTERLERGIAAGAEFMASAIRDLADRVTSELSEIRWELAQMRAVDEEILVVLKRPRSTEARELLDQGVRNLVNDKIDQAEERFRLALRLDNTDYQVLMNLSAVELRKGDAQKAMDFARDALTLPSDLDTRARADALWQLGRLYYATDDYEKALEIGGQSIAVVSIPRRSLQLGVYATLAGKLREGMSLIGTAVRQDSRLFSVVASTPDLEAERDRCLELLTQLHAEALAEVNSPAKNLEVKCANAEKLANVPELYKEHLRRCFNTTLRRARQGSYSECRASLTVLAALDPIPDLLRSLDQAAPALSQDRQNRELSEQLASAEAHVKKLPKHPGWLSFIAASSVAFFFGTIAPNTLFWPAAFWLVLGGALLCFWFNRAASQRHVIELQKQVADQGRALEVQKSKFTKLESAVLDAFTKAGCDIRPF